MPGTVCPFCGAYSVRSCEIEGVEDGCPWDDMLNEPDPDYLREMRDERRRLAEEDGWTFVAPRAALEDKP